MPLFQLNADQVRNQARDNPARSWPKRDATSRLRPDCLPMVRPKFTFQGNEKFFAIGSCFARNIEEFLVRQKLTVASRDLEFPEDEAYGGSRGNGLLIKYTPGSICEEITQAIGDGPNTPIEQYMVEKEDGVYVDVNLPMFYPSVTMQRGVERRMQVRDLFRKLASCEVVFITLGLIEEWYDNELGILISGMPEPLTVKKYPGRFLCKQNSYEEALGYTAKSIDMIHAVNPGARIVLTTSPVPLGRTFTLDDVIIANTLSKSMLRVVAQSLAVARPYVDYFPSYEMVMLSDPNSTWEPDDRHVRDIRVGQIMNHFFRTFLPQVAVEDAGQDTYLLAKNAMINRNPQAAIEHFRQMEESGVEDERMLFSYFQAAKRSRNIDLAAEICGKAISRKIKPKLFSAELLSLLLEHRRFDELRDLLPEALADRNRRFVALVADASLAYSAGETERMRESVRAASELDKRSGLRSPEPAWAREQLVILEARVAALV